ncbi:MAG: nitronate monooxygenase, partial [Parasporobacterium sp.]|nr:nitronate monooxygenase [Parasporobacterium sp.]
MANKVCEALNIKYPVIQGAMAWVATAPLAAAVSNAGGLGVLGVGFATPEIIREQIVKTRELTEKPFAANVFMIPALLERNNPIFLEEKPPVLYVDILANLDPVLADKYFKIWHEAGIKIVFKASFISDAIMAEKAGADVIIVKGWEGGGHVTDESTMVLVPQAADVLTVPLVAGGGIADGRGMAAAIMLGADGIEMGSAFCIAEETAVHENFKKSILEAGDMSTVITGYCTGEPC